MNKRGISPLIGSVLLIAFTIILFALISVWIRRAALEPGMDFSGEKVATSFDEINTRIGVMEYELLNESTVRLRISNEGSTVIKGLGVKIIGNSGIDLQKVENLSLQKLDVIIKDVIFDKDKIGSVNKVEITPVVSSGYAFSATVTKTLSEIIYNISAKTCAEQNGIICQSSENCDGSWITANDTTRCCSTTCSPIITPTCELTSVSITANCGTNNCEAGENITVNAVYTSQCPSTSIIQVDAKSADDSCIIKNSGGDMQGISVICNSGTCSENWLIPAIPVQCQDKTINAFVTNLYYPTIDPFNIKNNNTITPTGTFTFYTPSGSVCGNNICETGENCPQDNTSCIDNVCYEPTCTNGCGQIAVINGQNDETCLTPSYCDGAGGCVSSTYQCNDGIDNDGNGCRDYPGDPGCSSTSDDIESGGTCLSITGLVAYYSFEGNANDASGNNIHGTLIDGNTTNDDGNTPPQLTSDRNGNPNSAYYFDGVDDYISLPTSQLLNLTSHSVVMWLRVKNFKSYNMAVADTVGEFVGLSSSGTATITWRNASNYRYFYSNLPFYPNTNVDVWRFAVVTYDINGDNVNISRYVDSIYKGSNSEGKVGGYLPFPIVVIGSRAGSNYFDGAIDEVRIYNRALTSNEILTLFNI